MPGGVPEKVPASSTSGERPVRMADVLGAFSLASDFALGLQAEHGVRSCYLGMHIADELRLSAEDRAHLYYAELLKDAGCTTWTSQLATFWLVDELVAKRDLQFFRDAGNPLDVISWLAKYVAAGAPLTTRVTRSVDFLANGKEFMREGFESTCRVAARIAERLGMPEPVRAALMQVFEQWDGRGMPTGASREAISVISRIVLLTSFLEVFHRVQGREGARRVALARRGKAFDPQIVDAFISVARSDEFWRGFEDEQVAERVAAMEPQDSTHRTLGPEKVMDVALALADYADMKSPHLAGHSRRVADMAERISRVMRFAEPQIATTTIAALTHDVGIVAVSSFVLNKADAQRTQAEREEARLHPYHSQRILAKIPALETVSHIAAAHHERIDGGGFFRGLSGFQVPLGARVVAVADRFDELTHDTPEAPALDTEAAVEALRRESGTSLAPEAVEALIAALDGGEGARRPRARRREWPDGLTDREVEVLRLAARGLSRKELAKALFVSEGTVRSHLEHIYAKVGVANRSAATLYAMEHDLIE